MITYICVCISVTVSATKIVCALTFRITVLMLMLIKIGFMTSFMSSLTIWTFCTIAGFAGVAITLVVNTMVVMSRDRRFGTVLLRNRT